MPPYTVEASTDRGFHTRAAIRLAEAVQPPQIVIQLVTTCGPRSGPSLITKRIRPPAGGDWLKSLIEKSLD